MTPRRVLSLRDVAAIFGTKATEICAARDAYLPLPAKRPDPSLLPGGLCRRCGGCAGVDGQDGCTCQGGEA